MAAAATRQQKKIIEKTIQWLMLNFIHQRRIEKMGIVFDNLVPV